MEARGKTIEQWFSMIAQGQILLPRFQRHEAWRHGQIVGLLENILRKPALPIGALLVLEVGDTELFHSRSIVGAPQPSGKPQMHLLDGQQRMTALWRSLTEHYEDLSIFVSLRKAEPQEEGDATDDLVDDAPALRAEKRWMHKGSRRPIWLDNDHALFADGLLPIGCLCPGQRGEARLNRYQQAVKTGIATARKDAEGLDAEAKAAALAKIDALGDIDLGRIYGLRQRVASYMVPFLSLPVGTGKETALNVFIRMNTSASPLTDFDILVAQLEEDSGRSLHDMIADLAAKVPAIREYGSVEDNVLAVAALLNNRPALKTTYLDKAFGKQLAAVWPRLERGFARGLAFLRQEGMFGEKQIATEVAVYLTAALWADVPEHGYDAEGNARTLIRRALWRASLSERYAKTATTRAYADYRALARLIAGDVSAVPPDLLDEVAYPSPDQNALISAGWPARKDRLPRAMLALSLRQGAIDFADGARADSETVKRREHHHLFPVATFPDGADPASINRALNCALITWRTNRKFSATTPADYIRARTEAASHGEGEIRRRLATHLVPYDAIVAGDYETFLERRAALFANAIAALCQGREPNIVVEEATTGPQQADTAPAGSALAS